jgi:hypothetical protein
MRGSDDFPVDVLFDDQRVFSFWLRRDTEQDGQDLFCPWPSALERFLHGTTSVTLVDHVSKEPLHTQDLTIGPSSERIRVQDAQGNPLGLDKSRRLTRLFGSRTADHLEPLLGSINSVLSALETAGVRPFLAYGTLLGAVREGGFIGHDSDADLGYVSRHDHPVDVILESFRLQRVLASMGYSIYRYSGLAFKVTLRESDGKPRGLDVFGGFLRDGMLYLMGEVGSPFEREWLEPHSSVTLEGRTFPAPARPDRLLEAMYGPSWRVPDPAYRFETPASTSRRLTGWFRGTRVGLESRAARFDKKLDRGLREGPSDFVRWAREREPHVATAVDVGCGTGADALWLASQGLTAWALDYFPRASRAGVRQATAQDLPLHFGWLNLCEHRSVLATAASLCRAPGPRLVLARHVADSTNVTGRENLLRLAKVVVRDAGTCYLQVHTGRVGPATDDDVRIPRVESLVELVRHSGGTVVERHDLHEPVPGDSSASRKPNVCRLVVTWHRDT